MLKKCISSLIFAALSSSALAADPNGCPVPSAEKLVCAVVMCDFGLVMGEWSSECTEYKKDFAIYLATLGPFDKPPRCKMRDENCKKVGTAKKASLDASKCDELETVEAQTACKAAVQNNDNDTSEE